MQNAYVTSLDRRSADRYQITLEAHARHPSGRWSPITIADISTNGCAILGLDTYVPGAEIVISLPGLASKSAIVVWQRDDRTGAQFLEELHVSVVDHLAQQFH